MFTRKFRTQALPLQSVSLTTRVHQSLTAPLLLTRPDPDPADVNAICQSLTARQRDVLAVLLQGKSNKAICRVLNLAEQTVKNHVTAILKALKVTNRTEAVIRVNNAGTALVSFASTTPGHQDARRSHAAVTDSVRAHRPDLPLPPLELRVAQTGVRR